MRHETLIRSHAIACSITLTILGWTVPSKADAPASVAPLMGIMDRFSASDVPAMGPAETPAAPQKPTTQPDPTGLPGNGLAQHPMLYIGEGFNKMFVINAGKIVWTYSTGAGYEYDDAWMLSNGNIVFTRMQYIAEVTPQKQVVWRYDAPKGTEIHCCQPIGLDKVLFILNGLPPKLMVVNTKTNAVEVTHDLDFAQPPNPRNIHGEFRRVRYTSQGTYLVPYMSLGKIVEYDKDFYIVWTYAIKSPWAAIRLKNGNTLITDEGDKLTLEVNPQGQTVWQLTPDDLPPEYRFINTQSCTRLANGNTIICSRGGDKRQGPQLVEVTPDKKVVWVLHDFTDLGPATGVQILDDPGTPENPGESEH